MGKAVINRQQRDFKKLDFDIFVNVNVHAGKSNGGAVVLQRSSSLHHLASSVNSAPPLFIFCLIRPKSLFFSL